MALCILLDWQETSMSLARARGKFISEMKVISENVSDGAGENVDDVRPHLHVLSCFYRGMKVKEISGTFEDKTGDAVEVWIRFLQDMGWLMKESGATEKFSVSESGYAELAARGLVDSQ